MKGDDAAMYFTATERIDLTQFTASHFEEILLEKRKSVCVEDLEWPP